MKQYAESLLDATDVALELEGAWRLSAETCNALVDATGHEPPGGWRAFASLTAGTPWLNATRDAFERRIDARLLPSADRTVRRRLAESFTRTLVPPTTAAALFIVAGLHPAWGVHVAHHAHRQCEDIGPTTSSSELFPADVRDHVTDEIRNVITAIINAVAGAGPECAVGTFERAIENTVRNAATDVDRDGVDVPSGAISPWVDINTEHELSRWRVVDFVKSDIIDSWLRPSGVVEFDSDASAYRVNVGCVQSLTLF